jgi:hypothetical protein
MNKLNESKFMPFSSFSQIEKDEILNKNYSHVHKYVMENCDDKKRLNESIESISTKYGFSNFLFLPITNKLKTIEGFVVENFSFSLDALIKLENNKEKLDMLLKSRDIYDTVLKITNNKIIFEVVLLKKLHIISRNDLVYSDLLKDVKKYLNVITENSKKKDTKLRAEKLKFSAIYGNVSEDKIKNLVMKFVLEQKLELNDFVDYIAEKIMETNEMIQEKLDYLSSKEHFNHFLENTTDILFNKNGEFVFKGESK